MPDNANGRKINSSLDALRKQVNDLYTSTYYTTDNSEEYKTQVTNKLDDAIKNSTSSDDEYNNLSSTSRIVRKLLNSSNNTQNAASNKLNKNFATGKDDDITSLFQNNTLVASLMDNYSKTKYITQLDDEFDLICKYMTKLQAALDIKRDTVLCSDTYTKEFLNVTAKNSNPNSTENATIQNNIDQMMKKYDLSRKTETWYENTSKYGEEFVYCVPMSSALDQLLKNKSNTGVTVSESATITKREIMKEAFDQSNGKIRASINSNDAGEPVINITFNHSKILREAIENNLYLQRASGNSLFSGLSESFVIHETNDKFSDHLSKDGRDKTKVKFDSTIDNEIEFEDDDKSAADGLVNPNKATSKVRVNGAVLRSIKHDRVIPIYIEDTMFGVYYIKITNSSTDINSTGAVNGYGSITGMFNNGQVSTQGNNDQDTENKRNILLRTIAAKLSEKIDAAFINANADLKEEIYQILRFNDTYNQVNHAVEMDVLFIPADDIHHLKFREDPETHRGISDLWDSLVPAKQWITMMLTTVLGWTTRGFDRRVCYVKQSLDTNTAQSLLNVISTIKKGNFGARQMESVNNILNIVGRFNDFVIPVGSDGEAPIRFETVQGQDFNFNQDLMQNLEESAVNPILPLEIVNSSTGMDFAVRYTFTNAKLLRNVLKRQLIIENFLSEIFTKIYRFEYETNEEIIVTLPTPAFLSMTNGTNLLNNATQYADAITEVEMAGQEDDVKQLFKKRLIRKLIPAYMSDQDIEDIKNNISIDRAIQKSKAEDDYT